jgi:hypothetical protein
VTTPTLPIKDILAANPSWIRNDLGSLRDLEASVRQQGMLLPILLASDFRMLDGARRVAVAQRLRWKEVPVKVTDDWDQIVAYYKRANEPKMLPELRLPMRWGELDWLWSNVLKPAHEIKRRSQMGVIRRANIKRRAKGEDTSRISPYTGYTHDLAEMFQCAPSDIKTLRDTYRAIGLMRETHPAYVEKLMTLISEHETFLGITYVSKLRRGVRAVLNGDVSPEQALVTLKRSLASPKQVRPRGDSASTRYLSFPDERQPTISLQAVRNLAQMLEQLSWEAANFRNFEDPTEEFVTEIGKQIKDAVLRIQSMRRKLEHSLDPGESK